MPYDEYNEWIVFLAERPIGWREDDRFYKILQALGTKEPAEKVFPSLKPLYTAAEKEFVATAW